MQKKNPRVAIVHDFLLKLGGAERVTKVLADMYPDAPIYTLLYDEEAVKKDFPASRVVTSYLQKLPKFIRSKHVLLLRHFPSAIESFDFSEFDVVICSSNSFAHGVVTNLNTTQICYYHSPMRYVWDWYNEYFEDLKYGSFKKFVAKIFLSKIRLWDQLAAKRPQINIANSENVKRRIQKYYHKNAVVIYPPVDISKFKPVKNHEDFFLIVSTLTPYKQIALAIKFFNKIGKKLVIVGEGKQAAELKSISAKNIQFLGRKSDKAVAALMARCRGFIFPGEEDFGITPVEAMASGRPVFAYGHGGVVESVIDKKTGIFFKDPTIESFEQGFAKFLSWEKKYFKPIDAVNRAKLFSREKFENNMRNEVEHALDLL
jgi:glycosyltransferase involved in cell wall biosynthesis